MVSVHSKKSQYFSGIEPRTMTWEARRITTTLKRDMLQYAEI